MSGLLILLINILNFASADQASPLVIEKYEDRWFFEAPTTETKNYCLVFRPPELLSLIECKDHPLWLA